MNFNSKYVVIRGRAVRSSARAFSLLILLAAAIPAIGQSPEQHEREQAVEQIRSDFAVIQDLAPDLDRVSVTTDSGVIRGLLDTDFRIRKADYSSSAEEGLTREFYYRDGRLVFALEGRGRDPELHRFYFRDDAVIRVLGPNGEIDLASAEPRTRAAALLAAGVNARDALEPAGLMRFILKMGWAGFIITALISLLIVGLFVILAWQYLVPLHRAAKALVLARTRVSGSNDAPEKVFPDGPQPLRELWEAFLRDRNETTREHRGRHISTLNPAEVFHDDAVLGGYNRNFAVALAGFFTGLGILGTFFGLVIGLDGIDTSPEGMLDSVGGLLGGMSTAFYTSLVGIFFSLTWLVLDRVLLDRVQKASNSFLHAVRNRYPVESADQLLHHLLNVERAENEAIQETKTILEQQNGILQSLSVDLAVALQDAFTQSLGKSLTPQLEQMTAALEGLSVQMGDRQVSALDQMVEAFQEKLHSQMQGHIEGLANALGQTIAWQERVHGELEALVERLSNAGERQAALVEATNSAAATFANSLAALGEANRQIGATLGSLQTAASQIASVADGIGTQASGLDERIAALGRENDVYREANERIRIQLAQQIETLEGRLTSLDTFWQKVGQDLEQAAVRLQNGAMEFSALTTQKLHEIFSRFDSEMAKVVEHLAGTLAEIREVTDDLPRNLGTLGEHLTKHSDGLSLAAKKLDQAIEGLGSLGRFAEALTRLEPLGDSMSEAASTAGEASATFGRLIARLESVDGRFAQIASAIGNGESGSRVAGPLKG